MRIPLKKFDLKFLVRSLLVLMIALQANALFAQGITINGKVSNELKEPLPGVTIIIEGTTKGAITDINGLYSIQVPNKEAVLVYEFMGFVAQNITVGAQTTLNVVMKEDAIKVDEVVVVGYGVQKKESVVGAISQVKGESLVESGMSNMTSAISGKLSGVLTMQTSGQPGQDDATILIRGVSSWNGSSPLVLVDGVERSFSDMDPNEVETFSVLKDASATAVFGAKGANGVIIVTTKRGTKSAPKLSVSASYGLQTPTRVPNHIDSYTTMSAYNVAQMNEKYFTALKPQSVLEEYRNPTSEINKLKYPDVNWFDLVTHTFAPEVNANVNLRGGTDFVKYFASIGITHQGSLFKTYKSDEIDTGFKNDRINYRTNLDFALTRTTSLAFNVGGYINIRNELDSGTYSQSDIWRAVYCSGTAQFPAYYPGWLLNEIPDLDYPDASEDRLAYSNDPVGNPYTFLNQGDLDQYTTASLYSDIVLKQNLDMVTKGLSLQGKVALSTDFSHTSLTASWGFPEYELRLEDVGTANNPWFRLNQDGDVWFQPPLDVNVGGGLSSYNTRLYYEGSLNYNREFGEHDLSALVLVNRHQKNLGSGFPYYNEAWVARATYDYAGKYLLEVNLGYTGSEKFAPSNRFGFFPSFAVGYIVTNEKWFDDHMKWLNKLKLRYSDGKVGSDSGDRWLYQSEYSLSSGKIYEGKQPNLTAQWEEAHKRDIGVEFSILDNMFHFNVDLFDEQRDKMLLDPNNTTTFLIGNAGFKQINKGAVKKHGIEVEGRFQKTTSYGLTYRLNGMFGFNENRILEKNDLPYAAEYQRVANKPYSGVNSGVVTSGSGYLTSVDDIHNVILPASANPEKVVVGDYRYLDYDGDGIINTDDKYPIEGSYYPPITYSFGGGLSYKRFSLNILFQGNQGKYVNFNKNFEFSFNQGAYRIYQSALDYWSPANPTGTNQALHYYDNKDAPNLSWAGGNGFSGYTTLKDHTWRKSDYLRLKEVYLSYVFNTKSIKDVLGVSSLTVYASGNNICTFTNLIEGDPESTSFYTGTYPQLSAYKLGVKIGF